MALYSMLRRTSFSVLPLAIRAFGSPRPFHGVISTVLSARKGELASALCRRSFVPYLRFSTATATKPVSDESLIRVLQSEIECAQEEAHENVEEVPDNFPFKIEDTPGERTILLTRNYGDEIIKVQVDVPQSGVGEEEEAAEDDNDAEASVDSSIPLVVIITKGNGLSLEFGVTALPDEICIDSLTVKQPEGSEDELAYEGPDFNDLDENLQKAFHKYLEIRGIKPSTTNFLHEYMGNKENKEYLMWLKNIKDFIEK
ncbi:hypothetical protein I3843_09G195000 [Carya illinoinensis]|nr:hypothetical protein I3843_09G195000 [Carya illinoinensis]